MPKASRSSTSTLAAAARAVATGNDRAVGAFVRTAGPRVLRVVRQILGSYHPDVEDVAQEALMAALSALPRFRGDCAMSHFIWRIAALTAMNARRRLQLRERITSGSACANWPAADGPSPAEDALAALQREACRELLDKLPPAQAEVLVLHCVLGYTVAETAAATGVPINTIRGRLVTAKAALRQRLAHDPELCELLRGAS